jgi:hypothetical protein
MAAMVSKNGYSDRREDVAHDESKNTSTEQQLRGVEIRTGARGCSGTRAKFDFGAPVSQGAKAMHLHLYLGTETLWARAWAWSGGYGVKAPVGACSKARTDHGLMSPE